MFSSSEEMKRLILHTLGCTLNFTHPTGLVQTNLITAVLKIKIQTFKMGSVYLMKTKL